MALIRSTSISNCSPINWRFKPTVTPGDDNSLLPGIGLVYHKQQLQGLRLRSYGLDHPMDDNEISVYRLLANEEKLVSSNEKPEGESGETEEPDHMELPKINIVDKRVGNQVTTVIKVCKIPGSDEQDREQEDSSEDEGSSQDKIIINMRKKLKEKFYSKPPRFQDVKFIG